MDTLSLRVRFTGNSTCKLTGEAASEATGITGDSTRKLTGGFSPISYAARGLPASADIMYMDAHTADRGIAALQYAKL